MSVCLVYLPHPYLGEPDAQSPLGILYIAAVLREAGVPVTVANLTSEPEDCIDVPEAKLYGITVTSMELLQANRFAARLKEMHPDCRIILGGPGSVSHEFVDWKVVDSVFLGEAEERILDVVDDWPNLQRVYYGTPVDVTKLPLPARDLISYQGGRIFAIDNEGESVCLSTLRGCPYKCAFCTAPALTTELRYRTPESVAAEVRHVKAEYGITSFRISDDMFMVNSKRVREMCDAIGPENVRWRCSVRTKPFKKELAALMAHAGCTEVSFGIESFDDHVLRVLKKGTTAADNAQALEDAVDLGMTARALFMVKTPGQRPETVPINISYLERVPWTVASCTTFIPIPGSDVWAHPEEYGVRIVSRDLDEYNFYFFGPDGERPIPDVIRLKDRDPVEVDAESQVFRDYLKETGKVNRGKAHN